MSWILPPSKEQEEASAKAHAAEAARRFKEYQERDERKRAWLAANTCSHCGQHPPIPPWFY